MVRVRRAAHTLRVLHILRVQARVFKRGVIKGDRFEFSEILLSRIKCWQR
jgi:hypothetical protein